jgi:hypothetical protein
LLAFEIAIDLLTDCKTELSILLVMLMAFEEFACSLLVLLETFCAFCIFSSFLAASNTSLNPLFLGPSELLINEMDLFYF